MQFIILLNILYDLLALNICDLWCKIIYLLTDFLMIIFSCNFLERYTLIWVQSVYKFVCRLEQYLLKTTPFYISLQRLPYLLYSFSITIQIYSNFILVLYYFKFFVTSTQKSTNLYLSHLVTSLFLTYKFLI